jgi:hypothetical protein
MLPSQFVQLDKYEKAFVVAAIEIKMQEEKKKVKSLPKTKKR